MQNENLYSQHAEQALIGSILVNGDIVDEILNKIKIDDLYYPEHRYIFNAVIELDKQNKPVDIVTITDYLKMQNHIEMIGGAINLVTLANNATSSKNAIHYADIIINKSMLRELNKCSTIIAHKSQTGDDVDELLDEAENLILNIRENRAHETIEDATSIVKDAMQLIETRHEMGSNIIGIPTGFNILDYYTLGLQTGDLIVIGARPTMGKTALALQMAVYMALHDTPVLFFSLEMSKVQLMFRILAGLSCVDSRQVMTGRLNQDEFKLVSQAIARITHAPLHIDDSTSLGIYDLRARARRMKKRHGVKAIFIDFLQLMNPHKEESREREIAGLSQGLKSLARELRVPIIALSQLSRQPTYRGSSIPRLSDLRGSGAIEQDADVVMFIHRHQSEEEQDSTTANIIISKQRNGPTGKIEMMFHQKYATFEHNSQI